MLIQVQRDFVTTSPPQLAVESSLTAVLFAKSNLQTGEKMGVMKENKKDLCLFSIITVLTGELTAAFCPPETIPLVTNNCMNLD